MVSICSEFTYRGWVAMPDGTLCFTGNDGFITFYTPEMPMNRLCRQSYWKTCW